MSAKHTRTPWRVGMQPGPMIYGDKGTQVADLRCGDMLEKDEALANMRLILAAPDLLNMLERMLYEAREGEVTLCTMEHAEQAIAKARGTK